MRQTWDEFYLALADFMANRSKDSSTKIGAVIVKDNSIISVGYNGFPRGFNDNVEARHERPAKYSYTEHGERNAIFSAARAGIALAGATMYTQGVPCADCSRAVIQSGIIRVVCRKYPLENKPQWQQSCRLGKEMLEETGVEVTVVSDSA